MGLDRFQFEFLYQRFQLQRIELLLLAFIDVVVHEINRVPDEIVNKYIEGIDRDQQGHFARLKKFHLVLRQKSKPPVQHHNKRSTNQGKNEGDYRKPQDLFLQPVLQ